jgi:hypothetical protein
VTAGSVEEACKALPIALGQRAVSAGEECGERVGLVVKISVAVLSLASEVSNEEFDSLGRRSAGTLFIARAGRSVIGSASGHFTT